MHMEEMRLTVITENKGSSLTRGHLNKNRNSLLTLKPFLFIFQDTYNQSLYSKSKCYQ